MPRKQTKRVTIRLTPEEYNTLMWKRIEAAGVTWREFIFKMCTEGKIVSNDALRELNKELRYQGNNLNQLTRLAHQGEVNVVDLTELRKLYERLLDTIIERGE
ncbi:MAG: plasmid mobilization relaxosome protein MobC [Ruminococcus sp.]|nr:plasmid mobilization relaxosome protein MobC [Ruminococcus sp.]